MRPGFDGDRDCCPHSFLLTTHTQHVSLQCVCQSHDLFITSAFCLCPDGTGRFLPLLFHMVQSVSGQRQMCLFDPSASLASALHSTMEEVLPTQSQPLLLLPVHQPTQSGPDISSVASELHARSSHLKRCFWRQLVAMSTLLRRCSCLNHSQEHT